jgi:hypothetical protein
MGRRSETGRGALSWEGLAHLFPRRRRIANPEVYEYLQAASFRDAPTPVANMLAALQACQEAQSVANLAGTNRRFSNRARIGCSNPRPPLLNAGWRPS